jgi:subfamily B ATP-binding cassette protein MsbA
MTKLIKHRTVDTKKGSERKRSGEEVMAVYKRLMSIVLKFRFWFILGIIGIVLNALIDAGLTWSLKPLLDQGFIAKNQAFIDMLPFYVIIAFLIRGTASFTASYSISRISRNVIMILRQRIFSHLLRLPANTYDKKTSGGLIAILLYNVDQVSNASANSLIILVREVCTIIGLLAVMLIISWKLSLLFFAVAPFIALTATLSSKRIRRYGRRVQARMGDVTHIAEEAIEGYRVTRIFGGQRYEDNKFIAATTDNKNKELQVILTNAAASPIVQLIISVIIAITIYIATTHAGDITAGGFASILAAMLAILKPVKNITTINNTIQQGVVGAESIFELLDEEIERDEGKQVLERAKGDIVINNLNFSYLAAPEKAVLKNINLKVRSGETVALVGKSGSGKSTLVNLLPRFYDEYSGDIYVDGINTRCLTMESLRNQFAYVSQNVTLFNDTIGRNIAYGRFDDVTEDEIIKAAKAANAWEFIETLKNGLDTLIGENGLLLSGGQRQRIAIARALLKDAPLLILDEATSALDTESERKIQDALPRLIKNRTTLVIAHRLSTIESADKIIVLKNGEIVEAGSHAELLQLKGEYSKLHSLQFKDASDGTEAEQLQATVTA